MWTESKNQRRCELIGSDGLTPPEVAELEELQQEMLTHRKTEAPLPLDDLRRFHKEISMSTEPEVWKVERTKSGIEICNFTDMRHWHFRISQHVDGDKIILSDMILDRDMVTQLNAMFTNWLASGSLSPPTVEELEKRRQAVKDLWAGKGIPLHQAMEELRSGKPTDVIPGQEECEEPPYFL